jgi:signal transduction histidine kinase/CheY-like chemotaxis protein
MVTVVIEVAFFALFVVALVGVLRRRGRVEVGVLLVFATIVGLFSLQVLPLIKVTPPPWVVALAFVVLVAHAPFSLRLASDLARVPSWAIWASWIALAVLGAGLLVPATARLVVLPLIGYFVLVDTGAAVAMGLGARRRGGSAQVRLLAASAATALMALALLTLGFVSVSKEFGPTAGVIVQVAALGAVVAYLAAFMPPRWMRGLWQARSALSGTQRLLSTAEDDATDSWNRLMQLALEFSGADGAVLFAGPPAGAARRVAQAGIVSPEPTSLDAEAWHRILQLPAERDGNATLRAIFGGRADGDAADTDPLTGLSASVLSIPPADGDQLITVLLHRYRSLFGDDESALIQLLGSQAAVLADRQTALAQAAALGSRLSNTVEALRRASQAKSDFLASMSHELRTPLNAILGFSDLMRTEPADGDRRSVPTEWVEHINNAGRHLLELINDVLDLAKIEAGRIELHPEPLELNAAVGEVLAGVRPLADRKSLQVVTRVSADRAMADPGRFRQILYNLLSNAIKYTPERGSIRIETGRNDAGEIFVSVSDTGVGIAEEDFARVFEEFTQVGDPSQHQQGTGLGLALTRRLVEPHGGRLDLESTLGEGSRFTVTLPAVEVIPATSWAPSATVIEADVAPVGSDAVLLIEDDSHAVDLIANYLGSTEHRLIRAGSGMEGITAARQHRPRAILLDILLPDMDGWEVLRQLKADPDVRQIPVVVVTVVDERKLGFALGAADYLLKPIDKDALLRALDRCLPFAQVMTPNVLAIDDDPATLEILRHVLEPAGARLVTADGGREGLERAREGGLDLVICDLLMPEVDGFEVIAQLKASEETAATPILVLTGHELTSAEKERLNGQVIGFCEKGPNAGSALRSWLAAAIRPAQRAGFAADV